MPDEKGDQSKHPPNSNNTNNKQGNMRILKYLAATAIAVSGLASVASASLIDLGTRLLPSPLGSPTDEANFIETDQSLTFDLTYLNRFEYGKGFLDDGAVDALTHFTVTPTTDTPTAAITWNLVGTGFELSYVFVKDGTVDQLHLYHLYGVDDLQALIGAGTVTANGAKDISHITFFGVAANGAPPPPPPPPPPNGVPDGGATAMLLGTALACLGALRRRLA
jgi:hypothetical protein